MKKRTYIQPKMALVPVHVETIMIPGSPGLDQNTNYNPGAPARMMNIPAVQANDSAKVF